MLLSLGIFLALLAAGGAIPSLDRSVIEKGVLASNSEVTGYLTDHRWKRSLASLGVAAVKLLLKGAEHLYSTTRERVFFKSGGYAKAFDDFRRLSTTNVKVMRIKGEVIRQGNIGDRKVFLAKGDRSNSPALVISQSKPPQRRRVYIIYKN